MISKSSFRQLIALSLLIVIFTGCYDKETVDADIITIEESNDPIDIYIRENFLDKYGVAVRYKFVDRFVEVGKRVTPPKAELVIPMLDFLTEFWIEPYMEVPNGSDFFTDNVPAEVVLIGSLMYNADGTVTLGTADAGARITLTEVNFIDRENINWIFRQLGTIYHEFAHIVHQDHNLPTGFGQVTPSGYTSAGSWYNLTNQEALARGFVSPYGTSSENEDYAEIVAFLLYDPLFYENYINEEQGCTTVACDQLNEGRALIRRKLTMILAHYEQHTGVDLLLVREKIQEKLAQL